MTNKRCDCCRDSKEHLITYYVLDHVIHEDEEGFRCVAEIVDGEPQLNSNEQEAVRVCITCYNDIFTTAYAKFKERQLGFMSIRNGTY